MQEFVDFLGKQFPYDRLDADDLDRLGRAVEVEFFAPGTTIVAANGPHLDHLYVVRTGRVQVQDRGREVDELAPGDTFGHISVLSGLPPALSVVAETDTVCYRLPDPRGLLRQPERLTFAHYNSLVARNRLIGTGADRAARPVSAFMRSPLWCDATTSIRDAARQMSEQNQSCVLFQTAVGVGIMTDSDCRRHVATGEVSVDAQVESIGTAPARSASLSATAAEAYLEMLQHGVHHLVVDDERGRPVGVTRVFDLSSAEIRDPLVVRAAIDNAADLEQLEEASQLLRPTIIELYDAGVPALRASTVVAALAEAILEKCIRLEPTFGSVSPTSPAATPPCLQSSSWLVLGSLARREPLPQSDVDTAVVWAVTPPSSKDTAPASASLQAAERVIKTFERCGLSRCPNGANASNPLFNRSEDAWREAVMHWLRRPEGPASLLLSAMVADSRPITGLHLGRRVEAFIESQTAERDFLQEMLYEALSNRPPTGFVRDFVVEAGGSHRGELNLKRRGIGPVVALGRWIAVVTRMPIASTQDRLAHGAATGLLTTDEADTLRGSHAQMFDLMFAQEVEALRNGRPASRYLNPKRLDSLARRHLRESFRAIAAVQNTVEGSWVSRLP